MDNKKYYDYIISESFEDIETGVFSNCREINIDFKEKKFCNIEFNNCNSITIRDDYFRIEIYYAEHIILFSPNYFHITQGNVNIFARREGGIIKIKPKYSLIRIGTADKVEVIDECGDESFYVLTSILDGDFHFKDKGNKKIKQLRLRK